MSGVERKGREGERDRAPDLTTLTHSGLSLLASCALWLGLRGHTHTHIYLSMHVADEDILGRCVCVRVCVCVCDHIRICASVKQVANENK